MGTGLGRRAFVRALLAALAVGPLAACTSDPGPAPPPDPDDALREQAAERERALLREYDAALRARPGLAVRLAPLRAEHAQHLAALTGPPGSSAPAAPASPAAGLPPTTDAEALRSLVRVEREAAAVHGAAALGASSELAGLLASLSASESSHPVVLA